MRKKKLLNLSAIILGVLMCFSFSKVQATDSVFSDVDLTRDNLQAVAAANTLNAGATSKVLGISKNRRSGNYYQWNVNTTGDGKTVWKIATYPSTTSNTANYNDLYYCLNAAKGFGLSNGEMAEGSKDTYNVSYDMKSSTDKSNITNASGGNLGTNYNKILWILDNSYISTGNTYYKDSTEYKILMQKAGIEIENKNWDLNEDDIEVVQQMAIWYFTNNTGYTTLPSLYINGDQLSSIYYETDEYGQQITGAERQKKANKLYQYFINNASSTYSPVAPTLTLSNTSAKVDESGDYYVAGPFSLTKKNVSVNGLEVKINNTTLSSSDYKVVTSKTSNTNITDYNNLENFYIKVAKEKITNNQTTINIKVNGKYNTRTLTFMTNTGATNQPVVVIKNEEKDISDNTNINIDLTEVSVEKVWNDNENQDGVRPSNVKVALYEGSNKKDEQTLSSSNYWKYTWTGLLSGKTYIVKELNSSNIAIENNGQYNNDYTKVIYSTSGDKTTITNTHIPETTEVSVEKKWQDNNNQDGVRPTSIKVQLYANGNAEGESITLNSANSWKHMWTKLNKKALGVDITYTVKELDENGNPIIIDIDSDNKKYNDDYATVVYAVSGNKTTITNIHEPETVNIEGTKRWEDNDDQDGKRPERITVYLYADGEKIDSKEVTGPDWNYSFTSLPKYNNRTEIVYTIDEENVEGYTKTIKGYDITNTYEPETVNIEGTKRWEDNDNQDGKRPERITVYLYADGEKIDSKEVTGPDWNYSFTSLPKYNNRTEIVYTIDEENVEGYTKTIEGYDITNTYEPETVNIEGTKRWEDNDNQDGKRPERITVYLYADGEKIDSKEVAGPDWNYSFTSLPKYNNRTEIVYTIDEENVEGYTKTIEGYDITNTYEPETVNIEGTKRWEDNDNQDGKRPERITVYLYADGEKIDSKEVTGPDWNYSFTSLPKYNNRTEIVYTIDEENVEGYTKTIEGYDITNTYTPGKVSKTVIKAWEDSNNEDGIRPRSIEVQLYKTVNGIKTSMGDEYKVTLSERNSWKHIWNDLAEKENGTNIVYSVKETNVPTGYTVEYSSNDYSNTDTITIKNTHIVEEPTGKYNVILEKVDNLGNPLTGAKIKVNGKAYTVGSAKIAEDVNITSTNSITLEYTLEELTAPEGYLGLSTTKDIKIKLEIERLDKTYSVKRAYLVNENGEQTTDSEINVTLNTTTSTITIYVINNPIQPEFDLALRKFITKINDKTYSREPQVDTSTIATTGTATYKHTKEPLAVQVGDIVTYTIRVYNEGETDGYASEITDHLPEWLDFLPEDETNKTYLWTQDIKNNRKITTNITSKYSASGEELYNNRQSKQLLSAYDGGEELDYIDVQIRCKVNEEAQVKQLITNIAEISEMQDKEGTEVITDRDSTKANVNLPIDIELPDYKGHEDNKKDLTDGNYYYKGQEDDDDFEKVIVETFDLSLRKFITTVNEESVEPSREPLVDTSKLGTKDEEGNTITTATYTHSKEPVKVQTGDIVTYTIRVYNEGTLSGYANEITDYIPEGLEFVEDSSINISYGWRIEDGKLVTNYLSDSNINNVINGVTENTDGSKTLSYKDVQVQFKVVADPTAIVDNKIVNWAEISEDSNNDIDSTPGNNDKDEDDIDYEPIELTYFDLALRKFITKVDEIDYNNRVPQVDTSKIGTIDEETGKKITTANYTHTKDPVVVETGSTVIYTIRVYNEGTVAGYATEITDSIPEGLEFLPENEINSLYKWTMIDEDGNITQDVSKSVKITTNYLSQENDSSNIISAYQNSDGNIALDYKDVKVAFKVTEPNTSNRVVINIAEISKDSGDDIDSTPDNNTDGEDDIDKEYLEVKTFDLALQKWVTATKVTYNGKTKTTKTGFTADSTEMAKVDLVASQLKKTTVKFVYCIRVINEGDVAGYATEIKDYVPSGLKFVAEDNPDWILQKDGTVTTDKLKDTLLEPGQSATVEITLTWKNSSTNMGVKTNWAEISKDSGDDVDSTPDNYNKLEDDIDDAKVILSIKTGSVTMYIILTLISISILGGGTFLIKKYVISK